MRTSRKILPLIILLSSLTGCNLFNLHEHSFSDSWSMNETSHWHSATCEHKEISKNFGKHIDANNDQKCDVCEYVIPTPVVPHEHSFSSDWSKNESIHWHASTCGHSEYTKDLGTHTYGSDDRCTVCGYEKPLPGHTHTFSDAWSKDADNHWHTATCEHNDLIKDLATHTYGANNKCTVCGAEKPADPHEHTFSNQWNQNESCHWHAATCGHTDLIKDLGDHTYGLDNKCTICGQQKPIPPHEHTFADYWSKDENNHWRTSTCGHDELTKDLASHTYGDDGKCSVCGQQKPLPPHEHTFASEWSQDADSHWHAATCEHNELTQDLGAHIYGADGKCSVCGKQKPADPHQHVFSADWSKDGDNHWHAAMCEHTDLTKDLAAHSYGADGKCSVCGYEKPAPAHEHSFATEWSKDDNNHWHAATCEHTDLIKDLGNHNYGSDDKCTVCGKQKPLPPHEHTFATEWSKDADNHWHAASCEHTELTQDLGSHTYAADGKCSVCGYEKPLPPHVHTFASEWSHDADNHWHSATCEHIDLTKDLAAHVYGSDNKCTECGYEKPAPAHEHTFATEWSKDADNHWHTATCEHNNLTKDLAVHTYGADGKCSVCGYEKPAPAHEHSFATEWSKDANNHWHAASCEHTELIKDLGAHTYGANDKCTVCGKEKPIPPHEHTFSNEWMRDTEKHWHSATCEHTDLTKNLAAHTYGADNKCTVCGQEKPTPAHEHTFATEWSTNNTYHWHESTCGHNLISNFDEHNFDDDGRCTVCGQYDDKIRLHLNLTNCTVVGAKKIYNENEKVEFVIIPDANYYLPSQIEVIDPSSSQYNYNPLNGYFLMTVKNSITINISCTTEHVGGMYYLSSYNFYMDGNKLEQSYSFTYDEDFKKVIYSDDSDKEETYRETYTSGDYSNLSSKIIEETDEFGEEFVSYNYNEFGQILTEKSYSLFTFFEPVSTIFRYIKVYTYDDLHRLVRIDEYSDEELTELKRFYLFEYQTDENGVNYEYMACYAYSYDAEDYVLKRDSSTTTWSYDYDNNYYIYDYLSIDEDGDIDKKITKKYSLTSGFLMEEIYKNIRMCYEYNGYGDVISFKKYITNDNVEMLEYEIDGLYDEIGRLLNYKIKQYNKGELELDALLEVNLDSNNYVSEFIVKIYDDSSQEYVSIGNSVEFNYVYCPYVLGYVSQFEGFRLGNYFSALSDSGLFGDVF